MKVGNSNLHRNYFSFIDYKYITCLFLCLSRNYIDYLKKVNYKKMPIITRVDEKCCEQN